MKNERNIKLFTTKHLQDFNLKKYTKMGLNTRKGFGVNESI